MQKSTAFRLFFAFSLLVLGADSAMAQNACETALVGKSYTCEITSVDFPTGSSTVSMSFEHASWPGVNTDFQMAYGGTIPYACACMPSGKPGKLKGPEKSKTFSCIKAWSDGAGNDVVIDGTVAGGGSKILKGRWLSNSPGSDSYVYSCVEN